MSKNIMSSCHGEDVKIVSLFAPNDIFEEVKKIGIMGEEAFFNQDDVIKVDAGMIEHLKKKAQANDSGKYRLCMHHSPQDSLHEMYIVRGKWDYGRPEKHMHTTESHMIIEGVLLIVIFNDAGEIEDLFKLSKENYLSYRMDVNVYHMSIPLTDQVVYYEAKLGPFPNEGNVFAEWAPEAHDMEKVMEYKKALEEKIQRFDVERGI